MRVRCTSAALQQVARLRLPMTPSPRDAEPCCVLALFIVNGHTDVLEILTADDRYPLPLSYFDIIDGRVSRYWEFGVRDSAHGGGYVLGYPELVRDRKFLTQLVDADEAALEVHRRWGNRLDREFARPELRAASALQDRWVQCPACADAWEAMDEAGVIVCPTCSGEFNSPFAPGSP